MKVTWLGHSTVVLDLDGARVLTDPLLRPHAGPLRRLTPRPSASAWQHADAVLLSHLHHDHAQLASLRLLREVPILSDPANVAWLHRRRLDSARPLGDGWTRVSPVVEVRQVPAVHDDRPMPHRPNAANGHLVRGPSGTAYVAGDTELYDDMASLADLAERPIDVALVPVWGWGPRLSAGHLGPETAARAVALTGARYAVPVHWGTLHPPLFLRFGREWFDRPGERFARAVRHEAPGATPVVLEPGGAWSLPR